MRRSKKGFTLAEFIIISVVFIMLLAWLLVILIIPWTLEKYVGDVTIVDNNPIVVLEDNSVTINKGEKSKIKITPPFVSTEKIVFTINNPPEGLNISKQFIKNEFVINWTPKDTGNFEVELVFSDSKGKIDKDIITIHVIDKE